MRIQQMLSKISNKPDHVVHSPLKPTSFPADLSLLQLSHSSHSKKSAPPTEPNDIRITNRKQDPQPNFFQYNQRAPLMFSSDEEDDNPEPRFNYAIANQDVRPLSASVSPFLLNSQDPNDAKAPNKPEKHPQSEARHQSGEELTINELLGRQKPIKINEEVEKDNKIGEEIVLPKSHVSKASQPKLSPAKIHSHVNEVTINAKIEEAFGDRLAPSHSQPSKIEQMPSKKQPQYQNLTVSKSDNLLSMIPLPQQRENSVKQSSNFSKTDEILDRVKLQKNEDILIEEQSDQSSENHFKQQPKLNEESYMQPIVTARESVDSYPATQTKRRRNRIFDNSSARNKHKMNNTTPEKGVQTERTNNDSAAREEKPREYDYYPQIKALNVLNKLVDQINPNLARAPRAAPVDPHLFDFLASSVEDLEAGIRAFNNIAIIEKVEEPHLVRTRKQLKERIQESKAKVARFITIRIDEQLAESEQRVLRDFEELCRVFEVVDRVVQDYLDTKNRLAHLIESSKGFMVNLRRGELKKIYCTLRETAIEIETLKSVRASCGEHRLERMLREYLEGEIRPLAEMEQEMREKVENAGSSFKI